MTSELAQGRSGLRPIMFGVLAALVLMAAINYGTHAVERHQGSALATRQCFEQKGPMLRIENPTTGRIANICQLSESLFGVLVTERDGQTEVTSFVKDKMKRLEQVKNYLSNGGYTNVLP